MGDLIRPGRPAGFDHSHPAAQNCRVSAIASPGAGGMIDLVTGARGTVNGSTFTSGIGPFGQFQQSTATASYVSFPSRSPSTEPNGQLFAGIGWLSGTGGYVPTVSTNATSNDELTFGSGSRVSYFSNGASLALVIPAPGLYFIAGSRAPGAGSKPLNIVANNLLTGQVFNATSSIPAPGAITQYYLLSDTSDLPSGAQIYAASFSGTYLNLQQLLQWANDPWAFWYPRTKNIAPWFGSSSVVAGFSPWWANNNNSPVLGTGTY